MRPPSADVELEIEGTEFSPGVRRMQAATSKHLVFSASTCCHGLASATPPELFEPV